MLESAYFTGSRPASTPARNAAAEAADALDAKRKKKKKFDALLDQLAQDRRARHQDAATTYAQRYNDPDATHQPYRKSNTFISPPLDLMSLL